MYSQPKYSKTQPCLQHFYFISRVSPFGPPRLQPVSAPQVEFAETETAHCPSLVKNMIFIKSHFLLMWYRLKNLKSNIKTTFLFVSMESMGRRHCLWGSIELEGILGDTHQCLPNVKSDIYNERSLQEWRSEKIFNCTNLRK